MHPEFKPVTHKRVRNAWLRSTSLAFLLPNALNVPGEGIAFRQVTICDMDFDAVESSILGSLCRTPKVVDGVNDPILIECNRFRNVLESLSGERLCPRCYCTRRIR